MTGETGVMRLNGPCVITCCFHPPKERGINSEVNLCDCCKFRERCSECWQRGLALNPGQLMITRCQVARLNLLAEGRVCSRPAHLSWSPTRATHRARERVVSGSHSINIRGLAKKINLRLCSAAAPSHICQDLFVLATRATCAKFKWCGRTTPTQHKEAYIFPLMHLNENHQCVSCASVGPQCLVLMSVHPCCAHECILHA